MATMPALHRLIAMFTTRDGNAKSFSPAPQLSNVAAASQSMSSGQPRMVADKLFEKHPEIKQYEEVIAEGRADRERLRASLGTVEPT